MLRTLFAVVSACALVARAQVERTDFMLEYVGPCTELSNGGSHCVLKATSQVDTTLINGGGSVDFTSAPKLGGLSVQTVEASPPDATGRWNEVGNVTFGVHLDHANNYFNFTGECVGQRRSPAPGLQRCGSCRYEIGGGVGRFANAYGGFGCQACQDVHQLTLRLFCSGWAFTGSGADVNVVV